jgi:hypothetical protein
MRVAAATINLCVRAIMSSLRTCHPWVAWLRYSLGYEVDQIANDIGMSRAMVERHMRFKDQMEAAASGSPHPRLVEV